MSRILFGLLMVTMPASAQDGARAGASGGDAGAEPFPECVPLTDADDKPSEGTTCGDDEYTLLFSVANMTSFPGRCPNGPCELSGLLRLGIVISDDNGGWRQLAPGRVDGDKERCKMWHGDEDCLDLDGPTWVVDGDGTVPPTGHSDTGSDVTLSAECGLPDSVTFTATSADGSCSVSRVFSMTCTECDC